MNIIGFSETLTGPAIPARPALQGQTDFSFVAALQGVQPEAPPEPQPAGEPACAADCLVETLRNQIASAQNSLTSIEPEQSVSPPQDSRQTPTPKVATDAPALALQGVPVPPPSVTQVGRPTAEPEAKPDLELPAERPHRQARKSGQSDQIPREPQTTTSVSSAPANAPPAWIAPVAAAAVGQEEVQADCGPVVTNRRASGGKRPQGPRKSPVVGQALDGSEAARPTVVLAATVETELPSNQIALSLSKRARIRNSSAVVQLAGAPSGLADAGLTPAPEASSGSARADVGATPAPEVVLSSALVDQARPADAPAAPADLSPAQADVAAAPAPQVILSSALIDQARPADSLPAPADLSPGRADLARPADSLPAPADLSPGRADLARPVDSLTTPADLSPGRADLARPVDSLTAPADLSPGRADLARPVDSLTAPADLSPGRADLARPDAPAGPADLSPGRADLDRPADPLAPPANPSPALADWAGPVRPTARQARVSPTAAASSSLARVDPIAAGDAPAPPAELPRALAKRVTVDDFSVPADLVVPNPRVTPSVEDFVPAAPLAPKPRKSAAPTATAPVAAEASSELDRPVATGPIAPEAQISHLVAEMTAALVGSAPETSPLPARIESMLQAPQSPPKIPSRVTPNPAPPSLVVDRLGTRLNLSVVEVLPSAQVKAPMPAVAETAPAEPPKSLPKDLPALLDQLKVRGAALQPAPPETAQRPLLVEFLQRLQSSTPVQSVVERLEKTPLEEKRSEEKVDLPSPGNPGHLLPFDSKSGAAQETKETPAAIQLPDPVEHAQQLARQRGKALIDKPRELEVQLRSEKLGEVAARVKVETGGQWTAHLQLRDAEVEKSVRQELSLIQETRGLEGFTTSLSQDQRDGRAGFSFEQQQQQRAMTGFFQKKSATPSTSADPLPIVRSSSVRVSGLNIRA